jgi:hypothetical protein
MSCPPNVSPGPRHATVPSTLSSILIAWGLVSFISPVGGAVTLVVAKFAWVMSWTFLGAASAIWGGAIIGAVITLWVIGNFAYSRCWSRPEGSPECAAGVIESTEEAFSSASEELFPFTAMHDRVNLVVRCIYWPIVERNADYVYVNEDSNLSPILKCFYDTREVCSAVNGAFIGGCIASVGGIILAVIIAEVAIGCAFVWTCLIATTVAAIIAAVCVLLGAFVGGQIGKATAGETHPQSDMGQRLAEGDYVTIKGNLIALDDFRGAQALWFVKNTDRPGRSTLSRHFNHIDPDAQPLIDTCSRR